MAQAQNTMRKRARFKAELDRRLPKDEGGALWQEATDRLSELLNQRASLPEGVRSHTENKILPAAAIHLTLKEHIGRPEAYLIIEEAPFGTADSTGKKLAAVTRIPGMRSPFIKAWDPLTRKIFGETSGFLMAKTVMGDLIACERCRNAYEEMELLDRAFSNVIARTPDYPMPRRVLRAQDGRGVPCALPAPLRAPGHPRARPAARGAARLPAK